jgi:hypothetical protein
VRCNTTLKDYTVSTLDNDACSVHNRTDMGLFSDPFISIGPLAQERSINLLKKFYEQENPNAPADKDRRLIFIWHNFSIIAEVSKSNTF